MSLRLSSGFSLIELMIVVTIISILTVIAIPSYQDYTKRARFSEVIAATAPFKVAVALALQQGILPSELTAGSNGIPEDPLPTKNLENLSVENGIITAASTPIAGDATFILKPNEEGTEWSIDGTCLEKGLCSAS